MKYIIGNWKLNGDKNSCASFKAELEKFLGKRADSVVIAVAPPLPYLGDLRSDVFGLAAQDCSEYESGAYTSDVSADMLAESGVGYVIVGHSERRQYYNESDAQVAAKAARVLEAGIVPVVCIGESLETYEAGKQKEFLASQIKGSLAGIDVSKLVIAYEPVWAIGTGKTPTADEIDEIHEFIKAEAGGAAVLYGGSVKPANAAEILALNNVDGVLVGGASLKAADFSAIISACKK